MSDDKVTCKFCGVKRKNIWVLVAHMKYCHPEELKHISKERKDYYSKYNRKLQNLKN